MDKLLVLLCSLVLVSPSRGTTDPCSDLCCPDYNLKEDHGTFQKRLYEDTKWLSTNTASTNIGDLTAANNLLKNFCEENDVQGLSDCWPALITNHSGNAYSLTWFIPEEANVTAPASNSAVTLEVKDWFTVYTRSFGGFPALEQGRANAVALWGDLKTHLGKDCDLPAFSGVTYDKALSLVHHNEIWIYESDIC